MKEERRVFRNFQYRECDAFAEYLNEQARLGWHFKEWRMGLVFEKGIPASVEYVVEVFQKGAELDMKPAKDTEEYAEYCEAAGWKLIDSKRKFCIFRRESSDALPIFTAEERFQNIKKAEWKRWIHSYLGVILLAAEQWLCFWFLNFKRWIFLDCVLFSLFTLALLVFISALEFGAICVWERKTKYLLSVGKIPVYKKKVRKYWKCRLSLQLICSIGYCIFAYQEDFAYFIIGFSVLVGILLLIRLIIEMKRPSRSDNWLIQVGESSGVFLLLLVMIAVLSAGKSNKSQNMEIQKFPLIPSDYRDVEGELDFMEAGELNGILGAERYYKIAYVAEGIKTEDRFYNTDSLMYDIYQTKHLWILSKIWESETKGLAGYESSSEEWGGASVYRSAEGCYWVLYSDAMLILHDDTSLLDETQIQIVCEKLRFD